MRAHRGRLSGMETRRNTDESLERYLCQAVLRKHVLSSVIRVAIFSGLIASVPPHIQLLLWQKYETFHPVSP